MAHVSSGQSITAALWNALDDRIANLEANALQLGGTVGSGTLTPNVKVGSFSATTAASGALVFSHSAGFTPSRVFIQGVSPDSGSNNLINDVQVTAISATQVTLRIHGVGGTALPSGVACTGYFIAVA